MYKELGKKNKSNREKEVLNNFHSSGNNCPVRSYGDKYIYIDIGDRKEIEKGNRVDVYF